MRIQHNIMAMNAYRNYNNNTSALSKNLEKLSSGYKINRAGDDAAGLAISEKMRAQITGLDAAQKNVKDGISLVKTAEGAMQEIHDMLNRMDYLATQSANGTYDNEVDRANLQKEVASLKEEINRIADSANFNGIKLLDGSLDVNGELSITTSKPAVEDHMGVDGITVNTPEQGGGTNGTYTISIDKLFGAGDKFKITWGQGSAYDATSTDDGVAESAALLADTSMGGNAGAAELTFGTDFEGKTTAEQAASIAEKLGSNSAIADVFDIEVKGSNVVLTNKCEGNNQATVAKVEADATNKTADITTDEAKKAGTAGTDSTVTFTDLFKTTGGMEFNIGDTLTFTIKDQNGNDWTAKLELTDKIVSKTDDKTTQDNIMDALNGTLTGVSPVYFEANDKTAAAEESLKFSDVFTAARDGNDSMKLTAKDKGGVFVTGKDMTLKSSNGNSKTGTTAGTNTPGNAASYGVKLTGGNDSNYSVGDKLTISGKLSDGRTFDLELEAGKDFEIGDDEEATVKNIVSALAKGTNTVTVKDPNNKIADEEIAWNKIFSDVGGKNEIKVEYDATAKLKFTSQVEGTTLNGAITKVALKAADSGALSSDLRNGVQKTAASSSVSFNGLEEGATVEVDGKKYQFVTDAAKAEAGNTAVVVDDLTNGESIAKALADQLTKEADPTNPKYTVKQDGNTVTVTTTDKGKDVAAIAIDSGVPTHKDMVFELQPNKLKAGSTITVNGKTFEFIDKTKDPEAKAADGNIAIDVDMVKGDKAAINQSMVDALTAEGFEARLEDGKVKICNDGEEELKISFNNGEALTLQIGDTSDSYNQLKVSVGDMHTWAMNVDGVDISTQDGAAAAIDVVKNAINYVSSVRGDLGAIQNRLDHTANNLSVMAENIQDAESTIRDTDVAAEMMSYVKNNILVQSAQAMLAQANQVPQGVLQLLG